MPFVGGTVPAASSFRCDDALLGKLESRLVEQHRRVRYCPQTKQDIEIAFQTFGDISDPCVLLVMGLNGQGIVWEHDFCEMLAAKGPYFVVRYDNRDVGLSTKFDRLGKPSLIRLLLPKIMWRNDPIPYTLSDMAHDGICLLDALGIAAAHVVGVSMGGMLAQLMAIEHPGRVLSLTSIMSHTGSERQTHPALSTQAMLLRKPASDSTVDIAAFRTWWVSKMAGTRKIDPHRAFTLAMFSARRTQYRDGFTRHTAAIVRSPSRDAALQRLTIPSLVIHGDSDLLVPVENGYLTAKLIPKSRLVIRQGMGHSILPDDFQWIVEEIDDVVHRSAATPA